mmetsp:Transcript_34889/g.100451  ORF Transcript_34889/g.100451 Transcript_34889/m.100451 type:complete len:203 (+) Transcript_34889:1387-1995(+)
MRYAQSCGIFSLRKSLGKSRTSEASRSSATNLPSSDNSPHFLCFSVTCVSKSRNNFFKYLVFIVSSHLLRISKFKFSQFRSVSLTTGLFGSSRISLPIFFKRICKPTARSSSLVLNDSVITDQSFEKWSPIYLDSNSWCMVQRASSRRLTRWSKMRGIGSPECAAKPQNMEPWSSKRIALAKLPWTSRKDKCFSSFPAGGNT